MSLPPQNADDAPTHNDASSAALTLTGIKVRGGDREQILQALELNRQLLHEPQSGAEVDEIAVKDTIDDLLDQLLNRP